jgi:hypothetical protein
VTLPAPEPGLVIRYAYLWLREHQQGRDEGVKDRPCAIVLALSDDDGETRVTVLPITHSPPENAAACLEIPTETKKRLASCSTKAMSSFGRGLIFVRSRAVISAQLPMAFCRRAFSRSCVSASCS